MVSPNFLDAVMVSIDAVMVSTNLRCRDGVSKLFRCRDGVYSELHPQSPHQDLKQKNAALMNVAKKLCKDLKAKSEECDEMEGSKNEKIAEIRKLKRTLEAWMGVDLNYGIPMTRNRWSS